MRGIVIAGTHSGCGKTTVTLGIMAALGKKGLAVQPFKAGPDFIDAGLHGIAAGRRSRNLDQWMCGRDYVIECFQRHAGNADIAVIEGVMGMYDGDFSTANLAGLLNAPIVLVVDAYGMAESAGAVVYGFADFGMRIADCGLENTNSGARNSKSAIRIAGVIFNRVASENHYKRLKESVRDVPVLGYLPREMDFEIPHRHLGLTTAEESPLTEMNISKLADVMLRYVDVEYIIRSAEIDTREQKGQRAVTSAIRNPQSAIKIAVAYDKAFSFYYEDNLDALRDAGAEIVRFSPLDDRVVPDGVDAVYIGGGYPELHAGQLSRNTSMLGSISAWAGAGKPLYAECGGLMYLSKGIRDFDNTLFAMAGAFPFETRMLKKPCLGYREIVLNEDCILGNRGDRCRGHEFHYSKINNDRGQVPWAGGRGNVYSAYDSKGQPASVNGFRYKNTLASYVHVHFGSNSSLAEHFAGCIKGERIG